MRKTYPLFIVSILLVFSGSLAHADTLRPANSLPSTLIDDFEDQTLNGINPHRTNLWGSAWNTVVLNSSIGVTFNGSGHEDRYSAGVTGYTGVGNAYAIFQCPLLSSFTHPVNVACHGLKGIQFWMKGDGSRYRVEVPNAAVTDGHDWYGFEFTAPAGEWTLFQVPFEKMMRRYFGSQGDLPENLDGTDVSGIQFFPLRNGNFEYSLDDVGFYGDYIPVCPSPQSSPAVKQPPAPTPTPLGFGCPPTWIDDFEDPSRNHGPTRRNLMEGTWKIVGSPGAHVSSTFDHAGADGTRFSAGINGDLGNGREDSYAALQTSLTADGSPYNAAAHRLGGVQFWFRDDGRTYWFYLAGDNPSNDENYIFPIYPSGGTWTFVQIPFNKMDRKSWLENRSGQDHPDGTSIKALKFLFQGQGSFSFQVDQVAFFCGPPAPPTSTSTPLPTTVAIPPTSTNTPIPRRMIVPTPTPIPVIQAQVVPTPTPFPLPVLARPIAPIQSAPVRIRPTSTPIRRRPTRTPTPFPTATRLPALSRPALKPTPVPTWLPQLDPSQVIEFNLPPANIYVVFADGPGRYQVEVVDAAGTLLESIFDGKIVREGDQWLEWDGLDGKGKDAPPGQYFVIIYKDGKPLRSISVYRSWATRK